MRKAKQRVPWSQTLIRALSFFSPLILCATVYAMMQFFPPRSGDDVRSPFAGQREVSPQIEVQPKPPKVQLVRNGEAASRKLEIPRTAHITQPLQVIPEWHRFPPLPDSYKVDHPVGVRLLLTVAADGSVVDATIQQSSGTKSLDHQAVDWVKAHWRYKPAYNGTKPVAATTSAILFFEKQPISP